MIKLYTLLYEVKTMRMGPTSVVYGTIHGDLNMAEEIVTDALSTLDRNKKTVFMGEGGDANNRYPKDSESAYIYDKLRRAFPNLINDSWDGKDFDVTDPSAYVFSAIAQSTGLDKNTVNAGVYAAMVGQGQDPTEVAKLMSPDGERLLTNLGVQNPRLPYDEDIQLMYDLSFPQDTGGQEQDISKITNAYNKARDFNLVRKVKKYESAGYQVIAVAGESHLDLINTLQ
jgi:hypothetical protein